MSAGSFLKSVRDDGYNPAKPPKKNEDSGNMSGMGDPDESNSTSRIIKLSDDEQKAFEGSKPGQELECIVRGNLEEDGHFHVMSVSAPEGGYGGASPEEQMAKQVAQKVSPGMMA